MLAASNKKNPSMATTILEEETYNFAYHFHVNRIDAAMICGAEFEEFRNVAKSGLMQDDHFFVQLRTRLLTYGILGTKRGNTSIGCCAEVNATNSIYHKNSHISLNHVSLATAYRPKTMQTKEKCQICTEIFIDDAV